MGQWEGASFVEIARTLDPERRLLRDPHFSPPGGDSQLAVRDRMVAALEEIRARHAGEAIALVSHGVAIAVLLAHLCHGDTTRWREFHHHNTGYTRLCAVTLEPLELNCTDHLR
ncbi:MAG: hypothetical protein KatS3mg124_1107 [Porticoccaceae bacterium]|nr:MAG: hypothetical protein KatS3mg124_1107 [Porticoccaceae bacterium]